NVEKSELTLKTCSPFNYIGDALNRYLIESSLVCIR
ncbi:class D sortase, partial [Bacillus thuringiensis]|nr:class D sortase [Bacillus thuringiensis]